MSAIVRTNVVLDEELVARAQQLTGIKTKRDVNHFALRALVRLQEQAGARALRGELHWEGNLDPSREGRAHAVR